MANELSRSQRRNRRQPNDVVPIDGVVTSVQRTLLQQLVNPPERDKRTIAVSILDAVRRSPRLLAIYGKQKIFIKTPAGKKRKVTASGRASVLVAKGDRVTKGRTVLYELPDQGHTMGIANPNLLAMGRNTLMVLAAMVATGLANQDRIERIVQAPEGDRAAMALDLIADNAAAIANTIIYAAPDLVPGFDGKITAENLPHGANMAADFEARYPAAFEPAPWLVREAGAAATSPTDAFAELLTTGSATIGEQRYVIGTANAGPDGPRVLNIPLVMQQTALAYQNRVVRQADGSLLVQANIGDIEALRIRAEAAGIDPTILLAAAGYLAEHRDDFYSVTALASLLSNDFSTVAAPQLAFSRTGLSGRELTAYRLAVALESGASFFATDEETLLQSAFRLPGRIEDGVDGTIRGVARQLGFNPAADPLNDNVLALAYELLARAERVTEPLPENSIASVAKTRAIENISNDPRSVALVLQADGLGVSETLIVQMNNAVPDRRVNEQAFQAFVREYRIAAEDSTYDTHAARILRALDQLSSTGSYHDAANIAFLLQRTIAATVVQSARAQGLITSAPTAAVSDGEFSLALRTNLELASSYAAVSAASATLSDWAGLPRATDVALLALPRTATFDIAATLDFASQFVDTLRADALRMPIGRVIDGNANTLDNPSTAELAGFVDQRMRTIYAAIDQETGPSRGSASDRALDALQAEFGITPAQARAYALQVIGYESQGNSSNPPRNARGERITAVMAWMHHDMGTSATNLAFAYADATYLERRGENANRDLGQIYAENPLDAINEALVRAAFGDRATAVINGDRVSIGGRTFATASYALNVSAAINDRVKEMPRADEIDLIERLEAIDHLNQPLAANLSLADNDASPMAGAFMLLYDLPTALPILYTQWLDTLRTVHGTDHHAEGDATRVQAATYMAEGYLRHNANGEALGALRRGGSTTIDAAMAGQNPDVWMRDGQQIGVARARQRQAGFMLSAMLAEEALRASVEGDGSVLWSVSVAEALEQQSGRAAPTPIGLQRGKLPTSLAAPI